MAKFIVLMLYEVSKIHRDKVLHLTRHKIGTSERLFPANLLVHNEETKHYTTMA